MKPQPRNVLAKYLPANAVAYCAELFIKYNFDLKIVPPRKTKRGDYCFDRHSRRHRVTINNNLPPLAFLMTYIHKVAHLVTHIECKRPGKPHGLPWQNRYRRLTEPLYAMNIFDEQTLIVVKNHMRNIKASTCSDFDFYFALHQPDQQNDGTLVGHLEVGQHFTKNGELYVCQKHNRSRSLCQQVKTGAVFSVPKTTMVKRWLSNLPPNAKPKSVTLYDLEDGAKFKYAGEAWQLHHKRRTRALCKNLINGKMYLVSMSVPVTLPQR